MKTSVEGTMGEKLPPGFIIKSIEWDMMDKVKFVPLSILSSFSVRCALYPLTLIKTRLQIQKHNALYNGMLDAYVKIYKGEGFSGLYRGFWLSSIQLVSGVFYISIYEDTRQILARRDILNSKMRSFVAGAAASVVGQSIVVPFDVLSQHLMMMGLQNNVKDKGLKVAFNPLEIDASPGRSKFAITMDVIRKILKVDGIGGFYRGYFASLSVYVPNSSLWWGFYQLYQDQLFAIAPVWVSQLLIQTISGTLGGFTTVIITNPLDIVRTRMQVQRFDSMALAFKGLWKEEGLKMFAKGLSARLIQSASYSFGIILGYETIKRVSVKEEYKEYVRW
ncbi:solute carrier family 25 member 44 [Coccinella septempunctata]|uniref:solute carrier family 25 member 44 n=1 Tax=Coccinella septempunctata TaxID=41139 RepID=UPI001D0821FC|nr:solute carrier family 25 member 44 [Coccinella septempunctata]